VWSIVFRVVRRREQWTPAEVRALREHAERWRGRLSRRASGYDLSGLPAADELRAVTVPGPGRDAARDYLAVIKALRELEGLFPGLESFVEDPVFVREPTRPSTLDLARLRRRVLAELDPNEDAEDLAIDTLLREAREAYREWMLGSMLRERLLEAKRDFQMWKRAQQQTARLEPDDDEPVK
jgi:hypothetical protein